MAPQPLGPLSPMAQGHLMTIEIRDVDLVLSQALKMNMREVPSYCGSRVNNTTLGSRIGSVAFGENPTCQHITSLSQFIVKQVPCQPGLYSKQEPSVRTLWLGKEMVVSL